MLVLKHIKTTSSLHGTTLHALLKLWQKLCLESIFVPPEFLKNKKQNAGYIIPRAFPVPRNQPPTTPPGRHQQQPAGSCIDGRLTSAWSGLTSVGVWLGGSLEVFFFGGEVDLTFLEHTHRTKKKGIYCSCVEFYLFIFFKGVLQENFLN